MTNFDYISDAREIRDSLEGEPLARWRQEIDDGIDAGSTGTEILMAVRSTMAKILQSESSLSPALQARIKDYVMAANKLLGAL